MASNIKAWRKKHAKDIAMAAKTGLVLASCWGQLSWMCKKCGSWWAVRQGVEHNCAEDGETLEQ